MESRRITSSSRLRGAFVIVVLSFSSNRLNCVSSVFEEVGVVIELGWRGPVVCDGLEFSDSGFCVHNQALLLSHPG